MTSDELTVTAGAATDVGQRRTVNEDSFVAQAPVFLVADGMGGHDAGDLASAAVIAEFARHVGRSALESDEVRDTLEHAQARVTEIAGGGNAGTTLTGAVMATVGGDPYWLVVNIGDSRTYRFAGGALEQISVDHSVVQELVDAGALDADAAARDSRRNVITRAIGGGDGGDARADYWLLPVEQGDRLLACSDGLTGELDDDEIAAVLTAVADPAEAAAELVRRAVEHAGRDNVTAIVVDVARTGAEDDIDDTVPTGRLDGDTRPRASRLIEGAR
ncbi:MAG TPA: protein phosphatase 2C domain-containing protein [Microbacterium sp.]|nr:protein phosphatase 2C domain-containing protein [Microbacterium sp.]